ncbi:MAG TPA: tetratricopeptide repeat protein, partial [Bryobacteraceae bacterium]|nr:tetratricopeptide repeat protein [Bryobacteraceae bacterium]
IGPELEGLRVHPAAIDDEVLGLFVPRLVEIDRSKPNRLQVLAALLAECFTTHAAATWVMENSPWDLMAIYYIGIDHFSHAFMNFHPPKPDWVNEKEFQLYNDVVNSAYRLMDLFLARLLELAGPDTNVVLLSDHGFHSDHLRPAFIPRVPTGPTTQHRPLGILAMAGQNIRRDERIYGVNLLDVAPTVLSLFGLSAGHDMPGRVLVEAFEQTPALDRIESWDLVPGDDGGHPPGYDAPADDSAHLIEQFVALGYIEAQPEDRNLAAAISRRETKWNLARVHIAAWRFAEALPALEELAVECPDRPDFALSLADCRLRMGLYAEAEAGIAHIGTSTPLVSLIRGRIAFEQHRFRESVEHFTAAEHAAPRLPDVYLGLGLAWLKLRATADSERAFEKALAIDPHNAIALQGLTRVRLRQSRAADAIECALSSIACRHDLPLSHFLLGVALVRTGDAKRAIQAFETSLAFHPPLRASHRLLARLYGKTPEGARHREAARDFLRSRRAAIDRIEGARAEARRRNAGRPVPSAIKPLDFIVVSGLPRSGTSLMMRILEAAGLPIKTDGERKADEDNPDGYYEWEAIRKVGAHPEILLEAEGKVIKAISMLLPAMPAMHRYKVIFMDRPIAEVAASQMRMRHRRGAGAPAVTAEKMAEMLEAHRKETLRALRNTPGFEVLVVDYPRLVVDAETWAPRLGSFLGVDVPAAALLNTIRPDLYRNRNQT